MEVEKSPSKLAKKLCKIVRIVLYMMKKGIANGSSIIVELYMLLKKGKGASKVILSNIAMLRQHHHHCYSSLICRSNDISSTFISPQEYEFSCSNTPVYSSKRRLVRRVDTVEASPKSGFGHSLVLIKDRPLNGMHQVDNDAEEFIKKFYMDLKNQGRSAAMESPQSYYTCSVGDANESIDGLSIRENGYFP